ncbi:MAG: hypothetical protein F6J99_02575 [Moorea sp. SIO4G3]|nr:hypothetical protein [Moorena sp. SIO4G3]
MGSKPLLLRYPYFNTLVLERQGHSKTIALSQFKAVVLNGISDCNGIRGLKGFSKTIALSQFKGGISVMG